MSVKATMHWELEQLDLLEKLATRMEWAEDSVQYKKRKKAITREATVAIDRAKNGGGGAAEAAKVKLTWTTVDANVGDKHSWESAYPAMLQVVNSTKWKRDPDCPQSQVGKMPARRRVLHEDGETYWVRFIMNLPGDFTMQQGHPKAAWDEGEEGEEGEEGAEGEEGEEGEEGAAAPEDEDTEAEDKEPTKAEKKAAAKAAKAAKEAAAAEAEPAAKAGKSKKKADEPPEQEEMPERKRARKAPSRA